MKEDGNQQEVNEFSNSDLLCAFVSTDDKQLLEVVREEIQQRGSSKGITIVPILSSFISSKRKAIDESLKDGPSGLSYHEWNREILRTSTRVSYLEDFRNLLLAREQKKQIQERFGPINF